MRLFKKEYIYYAETPHERGKIKSSGTFESRKKGVKVYLDLMDYIRTSISKGAINLKKEDVHPNIKMLQRLK